VVGRTSRDNDEASLARREDRARGPEWRPVSLVQVRVLVQLLEEGRARTEVRRSSCTDRPPSSRYCAVYAVHACHSGAQFVLCECIP
jgi:hypothetical protein